MTNSLEIQLERMDSKLEKHIGVTETILKNQQETLTEIRDIVKEHAERFISREEIELMELAAASKTNELLNKKLIGFEERMDKKMKTIIGVVVGTIGIIFGLIEIIPLISTGG